jgi:hypothetical protein
VSYYSSLYTLSILLDNTSTLASELKEFYYNSVATKLYEGAPSRTGLRSQPWPSAAIDHMLATRNADIEPPPEYCLFVLSKYPAATVVEVGQTADTSGYASDLRVSGGKAYAADKIGMQVYNVSVPSAPVKSEFLDTPGTPPGIDTDGSYAFLASGLPLFQVVDLRLPGAMSVEATAPGGFEPRARKRVRRERQVGAFRYPTRLPDERQLPGSGAVPALSGPYLLWLRHRRSRPDVSGSPLCQLGRTHFSYLGGWRSRETASTLPPAADCVDVSNPAQPVGVGIFDSAGGGMQDVELRGTRAYTTDGAYFQPNSLKVLDVSQPAIPASVGSGLGSGMIVGYLSLYGDWAFVSDEGFGMGGPRQPGSAPP